MDDQPNPPDRDDPVTERAASMDSRPAEPQAGAGRAVNAAFTRRRPTEQPTPSTRTAGQQDLRIEGPGYPTGAGEEVASGSDPSGYAVRDADAALAAGSADDIRLGEGKAPDLGAEGDALEALVTPPGADALGGDRDTDPNLNGGHGIRMQAPEEGGVPIEEQDTEDSIIGHGHEDKAAWNRERISHLQELEEDESTTSTSAQMGVGGAVLAGVPAGWEGGMASPSVEMGDDEFDRELQEEEEILGDIAIEDLPGDILDDESINDPNNTPFLPEHRDLKDDNISIEELLVATPGEDILSSGAELGVNEELEMEDLNQTDNIEQLYEDQRHVTDWSSENNERRGNNDD